MKIYQPLLISLASFSCGVGQDAPVTTNSSSAIQQNNPYKN